MESRDSSDCTRNIHRPFTPEKDVTKKKPPWERLPKATDSKVHGCLDTDFGEVLFHYVIFTTKKMSIFRVRFTAFANSEETAFASPSFSRLLNTRQDNFQKLQTFWEISPKQIEENWMENQTIAGEGVPSWSLRLITKIILLNIYESKR